LDHLLGIDGALLVDPNGDCHAIGVILDGTASSHGNPGRGARYNSAVRYVESAFDRGIQTLAIVVSADGGVNYVPDLLPRLKRSEIDSKILELAKIETTHPLPRKKFNDVCDWLGQRRFYLLPADCTRINELLDSIDERAKKEDPNGIHIVHTPFSPMEGMDGSLFYEAE
jgi:hypothetical protein